MAKDSAKVGRLPMLVTESKHSLPMRVLVM